MSEFCDGCLSADYDAPIDPDCPACSEAVAPDVITAELDRCPLTVDEVVWIMDREP